MITPINRDEVALRSALRAARENVKRWLEISPESFADNERIEQWINIARLRRLEVERIETLLAEMTEGQSSRQSARHENENAAASYKQGATPQSENPLSN